MSRKPRAISFEELAERTRLGKLAAGLKPALGNTTHSASTETLAGWDEFEAKNRALPAQEQVD